MLLCQITNITSSLSFRDMVHFPVEIRHTHVICLEEGIEEVNGSGKNKIKNNKTPKQTKNPKLFTEND